jgi:uncharacterized protein with GYD domain
MMGAMTATITPVPLKRAAYYVYCGSYPRGYPRRRPGQTDPREIAIREVCADRGGKLLGVWFTLDSDDFVALAELPDDEAAREVGGLVRANQGEIRVMAGSRQRTEIAALATWMASPTEPGEQPL